MNKFYYTNPHYHGKMIMHYQDRLEAAKTLEEKIFVREQLFYHERMYIACQN
jgi:hypothetical protein